MSIHGRLDLVNSARRRLSAPSSKWAGGTRQPLPKLRRFVPHTFAAYHEPFLGSGAMFLDMWRRALLDGHRCRLTESNADPI